MAEDGKMRGVYYSGATRTFKNNPTIEEYVRLRRANPDEEIEVAVHSRLDWVFANEDLIHELGFDIYDILGVLDAHQQAISAVCLHLLDLIIERERMLRLGETQVVGRGEAIGDGLVNHFIGMILDSLDWNGDLEIPRDLIVLIRHQLGTVDSEIEKKQWAHGSRYTAIMIGHHLVENGREPSYRNVADILNVSATTVMRWFPETTLRKEMDRLKMLSIKPK